MSTESAIFQHDFEVKIWPNPTVGATRFFVETNDFESKTEVITLDILGRVVLKKAFSGRTEIDLGPTAKGVFQLFLTAENGQRAVEKVIVD